MMKTEKKDFLSIKRKYSKIMTLHGKQLSPNKRKAVDKEFDYTVDEAEKNVNISYEMIYKEIVELKRSNKRMEKLEETVKSNKEQSDKEISELKDQMTIITNTLNCREVITVFSRIFMKKLRDELESYGLYGLKDINEFVDNKHSVKWVKKKGNWRDKTPSSTLNSWGHSKAQVSKFNLRDPNETAGSAFKQELIPAYKKIANELGFSETSSVLVKLLTDVKTSLNKFVYGSNSIYNHTDTKEVVLEKYNTFKGDTPFFTRIIIAMDRESNFYRE